MKLNGVTIEDTFAEFGGDARSGIAHGATNKGEPGALIRLGRPRPGQNGDLAAQGREFECVVEQVDQDPTDLFLVDPYRRQSGLYLLADDHALLDRQRPEAFDGGFDQRWQRCAGEFDRHLAGL